MEHKNIQLNLGLDIPVTHYSIQNIKDPLLFGADDAAYEDFNILKGFSIEKNDCSAYLNENNKFMILCAPKGTGKTTLNLLWNNKLSQRQNHISIVKYDSEISPIINNDSYTEWSRSWKINILDAIFDALNKKNEFEAVDWKSVINLSRHNTGYNLIDIICEKLRKNNVSDIGYWKSIRNVKIWVFIDEIDQYFSKTPINICKISSLLTACRELTKLIDNLHIRTTIKPNVWAIVISQTPAMSNNRELIVEYKWKPDEIKSMLAKRISSYLFRYYSYSGNNSNSLLQNENYCIGLLFDLDTDFDLSEKNAEKRVLSNEMKFEPHKSLSLLGINRPRWVLSLCKEAIKKTTNNTKLTIKHIKDCLPDYGRDRIVDIATEYKAQCADIEQIFYAFNKQKTTFIYNKLLSLITEEIVKKRDIKIEGVSDKCDAVKIAKFLYEIGFLEPKNHISKSKQEFLPFTDNPFIIEEDRNAINKAADEFTWEIQPAFRNVLNLKRPTLEELFVSNKG